MSDFTHFNEQGRAKMVDVGEKPSSQRVAVAAGRVLVNENAFALIQSGGMKKGDVRYALNNNSKWNADESELPEGFSYDKGYSSPFFVTDVNRQEAVFDKPLILITDKKISSIQEILPLLEQIVQSGKKLVIIAEDIDWYIVLYVLFEQQVVGRFGIAVVRQPFAQAVPVGHGLKHQLVVAFRRPGSCLQNGGDHLAAHAADGDGVGILRAKGLQTGAQHRPHPVTSAAGLNMRLGSLQRAGTNIRSGCPFRSLFYQIQAQIGVVAAHVDNRFAGQTELCRQL